jgi:Protein of unknown function (DUF642)/PEP-CTERM motif
MRKTLVSALLAMPLLATPLMALAGPTELVVNGGFESNVLNNGSWQVFTNGQVQGWLAQDEIEIRNNVAGTAAGGSNYVELDANHNSSMSQDLHTQAGTDYLLSFYYSNRTGDSAATDGLSFKVGADYVILPALKTNNTGDNLWELFTTTFMATSAITRLTFTAMGTNDSYGSSLDSISVTPAVPEPETYAMLLGGLAVISFIGRKKKVDKV